MRILAVLFLVQSVQYRPLQVTGYRQITHDGRPKSEFTIAVSGIVSDAERLYFQEIEDDRFVVSQVHNSGGEVAAVPSPFANTLLFDISPNRAELLVGNLEKVSVISLWGVTPPCRSGPPAGKLVGAISDLVSRWNQDLSGQELRSLYRVERWWIAAQAGYPNRLDIGASMFSGWSTASLHTAR